MKFKIKNRWTGNVQIIAEIDCAEDTPTRVKLGLALKWGVETRADLTGADLMGADLTGAVLRGADLTRADLMRADLTRADLRGAVLMRADLTGANLMGANLTGADLTRADLMRADLTGADLTRADLRGAVLRGAVLRGTPVIKNIHQAVYNAASQPGALAMSDWHTCDTTHCRAGWVVTLAGQDGRNLENKFGTPAAASLIYLASDPKIGKLPDFYCDNDTALEDMKARAEQEAATP